MNQPDREAVFAASLAALLEGMPEGATFRQAREQILPPRIWVDTGIDGIEMYLDADQSARLLIRQFNPHVPTSPCTTSKPTPTSGDASARRTANE